ATANLYAENDRGARVAAALEQTDADVIVVDELTPEIVRDLDAGGLSAQYPYRLLRDEENPQVIGLCSKYPLAGATVVRLGPSRTLTATITVHGVPVEVWGMHVYAP